MIWVNINEKFNSDIDYIFVKDFFKRKYYDDMDLQQHWSLNNARLK